MRYDLENIKLGFIIIELESTQRAQITFKPQAAIV